jgi:hypothetical protein
MIPASNRNKTNTIQDFIQLLTAVKEKYGNLKVRGTNAGVGDYDTFYQWDDIKVVTQTSVLSDVQGDDTGYLVFEIY